MHSGMGEGLIKKVLDELGRLARRMVLQGGKQGGSHQQLLEDAAGLTGDAAVLVRCLLCRAAWGGMPGDVDLLKGECPTLQQSFVWSLDRNWGSACCRDLPHQKHGWFGAVQLVCSCTRP
jgi:hypothetical protein